MPLFDVAILEQPSKKDAEDGKGEQLVFGPTSVVAKDAQSAAIAAVIDATGDRLRGVDRQRMQVLVRPFA